MHQFQTITDPMRFAEAVELGFAGTVTYWADGDTAEAAGSVSAVRDYSVDYLGAQPRYRSLVKVTRPSGQVRFIELDSLVSLYIRAL